MASHRHKMWSFLMISDSHKQTCKQRKCQSQTRWQMYKWRRELKCRNVAVLPHGCWIHHLEWPFPQLISISTSCFIKLCCNECVLLVPIVSLQSSYHWSNSNQTKSPEGLRFSGEPRRWLMPLPAFPPQLILYPVNKQVLWSSSAAVQQDCVQSCS